MTFITDIKILQKKNNTRVKIIDANQSKKEVCDQIIEIIEKKFK